MNAGLFGLRFGGGKVWGHEQTIAYAPNFLESSSKAIFLNSNLVIQAPLPVFKPYATAGLGSIFSWGSGVGDIGSKSPSITEAALSYYLQVRLVSELTLAAIPPLAFRIRR